MSALSDFHFIRPAWLLLLPVATLIWLLGRRLRDPLRGWRSVIDPDLLSTMTVGDETINGWREIGYLATGVIAVVALAGPTWRPEPSPFADDPAPVIVVLRAGETMEQTDLLPSRMERSRLKVLDFAERRKGQPIGLISYAGSAHLVLPPTRDTSVVAAMAAEISPDIMPKAGDDLAAALRLAARTLRGGGGAIVVVADTVLEGNDRKLATFRQSNSVEVLFLAIAREDTPEMDSIRRAAKAVGGRTETMRADSADIDVLLRRTAMAPIAAIDKGGKRWAEAGWWLVPLLALLTLPDFRRVRCVDALEQSP